MVFQFSAADFIKQYSGRQNTHNAPQNWVNKRCTLLCAPVSHNATLSCRPLCSALRHIYDVVDSEWVSSCVRNHPLTHPLTHSLTPCPLHRGRHDSVALWDTGAQSSALRSFTQFCGALWVFCRPLYSEWKSATENWNNTTKWRLPYIVHYIRDSGRFRTQLWRQPYQAITFF